MSEFGFPSFLSRWASQGCNCLSLVRLYIVTSTTPSVQQHSPRYQNPLSIFFYKKHQNISAIDKSYTHLVGTAVFRLVVQKSRRESTLRVLLVVGILNCACTDSRHDFWTTNLKTAVSQKETLGVVKCQ